MNIRLLTKENAEDAAALIKAAAEALEGAGIDQWDEEYPSVTDITEDIAHAEAFGFFENGRLYAYMVLNQHNDPEYSDIDFEDKSESALALHRLAVHPDRQGRGLAGRMVQFSEKYAINNGFTSIRLDAFSKNPAALRLYENRGYQRRGAVRFRKGEFFIYEKMIQPLEYRDMNPDESLAVLKLARSVFPFFYRLFMHGFKNAVIAVSGGRIVGGAVWHRFRAGGKIFGYLDFGFTDKDYRGLGIGRETYTRAIRKMNEKKCDAVGALVLCDNTPSWKILAENGFVRADYKTLLKRFGLRGTVKVCFETAYAFVPGAELWISDGEYKKRSSISEAALLIGSAGMIAFLQGLYLRGDKIIFALLSVSAVYLSRIVFARLLSSGSGAKLRFRVWRSGMMMPVIVFFSGGIYPIDGGFYPDSELWNYRDYRKRLGRAGLGAWLSTLILTGVLLVLHRTVPDAFSMVSGAGNWLYMMLIFDCLPFLLESWPGARVWKWSKTIFFIMFSISILTLIMLFML